MKLSINQSTFKHYALTKKDTLLVTGVCLTLFIWFFSYYSNNQDLIARYSYEIKSLETQQRTITKTKSLTIKMEENIKNLKLKLRAPGKEAALTNPKKPAAHMTTLAHKACKAGLRLDSCIMQKQKNKQWFTQQNIVYEVTGSTDQIKKFIADIQHSDYALRCSHLTLKKIDPTTSHLACTLQFLLFKPKATCATISPSSVTITKDIRPQERVNQPKTVVPTVKQANATAQKTPLVPVNI